MYYGVLRYILVRSGPNNASMHADIVLCSVLCHHACTCSLLMRRVFLSWSLIFFSISASVNSWTVGPHSSSSEGSRRATSIGGRASLQQQGGRTLCTITSRHCTSLTYVACLSGYSCHCCCCCIDNFRSTAALQHGLWNSCPATAYVDLRYAGGSERVLAGGSTSSMTCKVCIVENFAEENS